jgi:cellulose synthase/poly-beta-1,6-N-acetylglucosamine synthase-like glycosyltransferase
MAIEILTRLQYFFLIYTLILGLAYLLLNILALFSVKNYMGGEAYEAFLRNYSDFELPISIIVPAYNEELTIESTVRSLLLLKYSNYEIIVVNDGSTDSTLPLLIDNFGLLKIPQSFSRRLETKPVRAFYLSTLYPNLKVIDKENGGKSDALNAGLNACMYPLFCSIDSDSILDRNSLQRVIKPFLNDPRTVAAGGTIRIVNGSEVREGTLIKANLPFKLLERFQIIEYLRAFLFGRIGWGTINCLMVLSGAFSIFRKDKVIEAGGYKTGIVGEDMEMVVRLHRFLRKKKEKYRITFVPDPICWTEAPSDFTTLRKQRIRWQRGLGESLALNLGLLFHPRGGLVGWLAFPFMIFFEFFGPIVEIAGYIFVIVGLIMGFVSYKIALLFFALAVGLGVLISLVSLLIEEMSFHIYGENAQMLKLFLVAILENFGYRQLISWWRLQGVFASLLTQKAEWGHMRRIGTWDSKA